MKRKIIKVLLLILYPALLFVSTHFGDRNDLSIILVVATLLPLYFYFLKDVISSFQNQFYLLLSYGIILRLVVVGSPALWSDDIYRYLFDAKICLEGISPYRYTPEGFVKLGAGLNLGLESFLSKMNSPNYYSVYPVFIQWFFSLGTILGNAFGSVFLGIQLLFFGLDILNLLLIRKLYPESSNLSYWLYFGNPVVIFEGISQMHPEILLVTGCLLLFLSRSIPFILSSFFLLTQLKFNAFLFVLGIKWNRKTIVSLFLIFILSLGLWKVTVFSDLVLQGSAGLGLFFHSFRFAGILEPIFYFLLSLFRAEYLSGVISFAVVSILYFFCFQKKIYWSLNLPSRFFIIYSLFLLFSPVVHPWYWIPWVLFVMGMEKKEGLVSVVSFIAFLSYGLYVYKDFVYFHWVVSVFVLGFYGFKQINYLRKTT
ncbi:hypothetical protein EHQ30_01540 [Leptospira brenneri]|uniref:DUF2029 domain-containing protein n=1 Tax=Leptospira brenneri TaxID=2023182 RepID=A0A5F1Z6Y4_9LEPT|nr:hypothetical protein [Leptospira brenneri]TGK95348.1 hypothetical protein EHQ30_01540 [Leptospira brenneri]